MSKIIILCTSYEIFQNTLCLATLNYPAHSITIVVSGKHNLFKFFQVINERVFHNSINLIFLEPYIVTIRERRAKSSRISRILNLFPDIIKERRYLKEIYNKYFAEMEGREELFLV